MWKIYIFLKTLNQPNKDSGQKKKRKKGKKLRRQKKKKKKLGQEEMTNK